MAGYSAVCLVQLRSCRLLQAGLTAAVNTVHSRIALVHQAGVLTTEQTNDNYSLPPTVFSLDRCSHDDGPLAEGEFDTSACTVECPRHGSLFDVRTGKPKTLPAFLPVETFEARVEDDEVKLEL